MTKKNLVQVVIGGKVLTMGGSEDELHIQKVASCVNRKLQELEPMESYRALPVDLKPILVELNLAEELIQARETIEMLKADLQMRENELSEVKQMLVETQIQLEEIESSAVQMTFADVGWMPEQMSGGQNSQAQTNADGKQTSRTLQDADEGKGSRTSQNSDEGKESRTLQKVAGKQETRILQEADGNSRHKKSGKR